MELDPGEALVEWGENARVERRLSGGNRSEVWGVTIDGKPHVLRKTRRSPDALAWELDLVEFLGSRGVGTPVVVPTRRGARAVGPFFVQSWVEGDSPSTEVEWREVERTLKRIHQLTRGWPQRPTFASAVELLTRDQGGDVDLRRMPTEAVRACCAAWRALANAPVSAIHGDPRGNVLMAGTGVVLIDWDEARVDASIFDLAGLPITGLSTTEERRAATAWEAATSWVIEPEYARRRIAELF